jgi:hypothetical protein
MKPLTWITVRRKVSELKGMPRNPRRLTDEQRAQLTESIQKFNLVEIPVIDRDNTIIAGHQRVSILIALGRQDETIEVRMPSRKLTDAERREYNIRSNKNTGEWDIDILREDFSALELQSFGFSMPELKDLRIEVEPDIRQDEIPKPPRKVRTKVGDLYELGNHRLICGDSMLPETIKQLFGDKKADLIFTDPPYDFKNVQGIVDLVNSITDRNVIIMATERLLVDIIRRSNWHLRSLFFAITPKAEPRMKYFYRRHIPIAHFCLSNAKASDWINTHEGLSSLIELHQYRSLLEDSEAVFHAKPLRLPLHFIKSFKGDIVFDPFCGYGSTLIACEQTERRCFTVEINPLYCDYTVARWEEFTGNKAILKRRGKS